MSYVGFCENLRIRAIIIDNFGTNLSFQLHICNPLFENAAPNSVFETCGGGLGPIHSSPNNNIRGFEWLIL